MDKDALKERISWHKMTFSFVLTIDTACIAWFINNYDKAKILIVYYSLFVIILLTGSLFTFIYKINDNIKKMEE